MPTLRLASAAELYRWAVDQARKAAIGDQGAEYMSGIYLEQAYEDLGVQPGTVSVAVVR